MADATASDSPPRHGRTKIATRFHEAGPDGRVGLVPLANYLQQAAGEHADALGLGAHRLMQDGLFWVLTRQFIEIDRWPEGGARLTVETWPSDRPRQLFRRDFLVRDGATSTVLARATSTWALIDGETRRAVKAPPWIAESIAYDTVRATEFPVRQIPRVDAPDHERRILTRWMDVDQNGHVNNASLAGFVLEALPSDVLAQSRLRAIDMAFRAECGAGSVVRSTAKALDAGRFSHKADREDGAEMIRATTEWQMRDLDD